MAHSFIRLLTRRYNHVTLYAAAAEIVDQKVWDNLPAETGRLTKAQCATLLLNHATANPWRGTPPNRVSTYTYIENRCNAIAETTKGITMKDVEGATEE